MKLREFNHDYLVNLLEKLSQENRTLVLLGDFNANLLKYDIGTNISNFLDLMYSFFLLPHIVSPTRTTAVLASLTDNIFTNNCNFPYTSGSLAITLSHHHVQFLIMENQCNLSKNKKENQLYLDFQEIEKNKIIVSAGNYDAFFENLPSPPDPSFESILFTLCISPFIQAIT